MIPNTEKYLKAEIRKSQILDAAIELSITIGYQRITRDVVASHLKVSTGLITHYFNSIFMLRRAILKTAITRQILPIIAQGLAVKDSYVLKIPTELKTKVINHLARQ